MNRALFLSASVPDIRRHPKYHETADRSAIRDAIRALVTVALPTMTLVWGGHPAITPLIRVVVDSLGYTGTSRVRLFQSEYFRGVMPVDNASFESVVVIQGVGENRDASLERMRHEMLTSEPFEAGVFIGGMEGVESEYQMFRRLHPHAKALPIASTGAAARIIFERFQYTMPELETDLAYQSLFRRLLDLPNDRTQSPRGE
jgi:hypothetical protein